MSFRDLPDPVAPVKSEAKSLNAQVSVVEPPAPAPKPEPAEALQWAFGLLVTDA